MYEHDLNSAFSRIKADEELKDRIGERIEKMDKRTIRKTRKATGVIICAAALGLTTAFAASPAGREAISGVIDYFASEQAREITSLEELSRYNEAVGSSVSRDGVTLTLDNVAADDNFVHVFYTVVFDEPFDTEDGGVWVECIIDGVIGIYGNNNNVEGYFADDRTYKGVMKLNVSTRDIPDDFKLELLMADDSQSMDIIDRLYAANGSDENAELTETEKESLLYISADIDKSAVEVNSLTKDINKELWHGVELEKLVFSPFGNQFVLKADTREMEDEELERVLSSMDPFALFDENGVCLDVLNTGMQATPLDYTRNSFEFLKADKDTKSLTFVPVGYIEPDGDVEVIKQKTGTYPLTYKVSDYGSVVVTGVRFKDGEIAIDYYKDGYVLYDPGFVLENDSGETAEPGGKLGCVRYTDVHYETNSYTARYVYDAYDENGEKIPADDSVSAEKLKENLTTLGIFENSYIALDYDNAVTVGIN